MKHYVVAAVSAIFAVEAAALACSCLAPPDDPVLLRRFAAESAKGAVALVEVEVLTTYRPGESERLRVTRTLAGSAPAQFRVQRGAFASGASCDVTYTAGDRDLVILYPASASATSGLPVLPISGLCTQVMFAKPEFREEVARLIKQAKSAPDERG